MNFWENSVDKIEVKSGGVKELANVGDAMTDIVYALSYMTRNAGGFTLPPFCIGNQHFIPNGATTCICGKVQAE